MLARISSFSARIPTPTGRSCVDALKLTNVDVGGGWLIFALPPAEVAVHPSDKNGVHEFYLMCDDVRAFASEMRDQNIACTPLQDEAWGRLVHVRLPGGGALGVYQPRHARPESMAAEPGGWKSGRSLTKPRAKRATRRPKRAHPRHR